MEPEQQVNIGRYLRFVVVFLLIMFGALGVYEYYYGAEALETQKLQQEFNATNLPGESATIASTTEK